MANKKAKKTGKTMGKKAMKKTKGGAVDMFLKLSPTTTLSPTLNTSLDGSSLNFLK